MRAGILLGLFSTAIVLGTADARASSIGVNFIGNNGAAGTLASGTSAGVAAQTNWNNQGSDTGSNSSLLDDTGAATGATLSYTGSGSHGVYTVNFSNNGGPITTAGGDEELMSGFIYGTTTVSVGNLPAAITQGGYDVYVYYLNDAARADQTISLTPTGGSSTDFHANLIAGAATGYVDGNINTPMTYSLTTGTNSGNANDSDYALFTGLTATGFSFTVSAGGNGAVAGFQIVSVPEPSSLALLAVGALGLCLVARRRRFAT